MAVRCTLIFLSLVAIIETIQGTSCDPKTAKCQEDYSSCLDKCIYDSKCRSACASKKYTCLITCEGPSCVEVFFQSLYDPNTEFIQCKQILGTCQAFKKKCSCKKSCNRECDNTSGPANTLCKQNCNSNCYSLFKQDLCDLERAICSYECSTELDNCPGSTNEAKINCENKYIHCVSSCFNNDCKCKKGTLKLNTSDGE